MGQSAGGVAGSMCHSEANKTVTGEEMRGNKRVEIELNKRGESAYGVPFRSLTPPLPISDFVAHPIDGLGYYKLLLSP